MQIYTGHCLCGMSHFSVNIENLDVYACHCTTCQNGRAALPCIWKPQACQLWNTIQ